jgi:hypothetical protein
VCGDDGTTDPFPTPLDFYVSELTPGTSYQFDLVYSVVDGDTISIYANGLTTTSPTYGAADNGAPIVMTVTGV